MRKADKEKLCKNRVGVRDRQSSAAWKHCFQYLILVPLFAISLLTHFSHLSALTESLVQVKLNIGKKKTDKLKTD